MGIDGLQKPAILLETCHELASNQGGSSNTPTRFLLQKPEPVGFKGLNHGIVLVILATYKIPFKLRAD